MLKRYLIKGLAGLAFILALVWINLFYQQRSHFMEAEKYFAESSWKLAIREYDAALHLYTPWSGYIQKSAERLWQIGEMFEKDEKLEWAVNAYASIRSSFYASRGLYNPGRDWIRKCEDKIADIDVRMLLRDKAISGDEADIERQKFLYVMAVERTPKRGWSLLMEAGFFGWVASVIFTIMKGFNDNGTMRGRPFIYGILSFCFSFAVWVISLWKA